MGVCNTRACSHRIPAITTAIFSSSALALLTLSGTTCSFLELRAKEGHLLYVPDSSYPPMDTSTSMGPMCSNDLYAETLREDLMYIVSRVCLYVAIAVGSIACIIAWALSLFVGPTETNWKLLSVFSAVTALLQMPIFLLFETSPCTEFPSEQECFLDVGSFFLILSTILWITVTLATQCLDPPNWADELNAWRVKRSTRDAHVQPAQPVPNGNRSLRDDNTLGGDSQSPLLKSKKRGPLGSLFPWSAQRRWARNAELPPVQTDSLSEGGEEEGLQQNKLAKFYSDDEESRLVLNVLPNGKRPGDDAKSTHSFEDLDSFVQAAEEGRLPEYESPIKPSSQKEWEYTDKEKAEFQETLTIVSTVQKRLIHGSYTDLENPEPATGENQLVVSSTPTSKYGITSPENVDTPMEETRCTPEKSIKASYVIKSLTENLKKRSRARRSRKNQYALMDDNDMESSYPVFPREVVFTKNEGDELPDLPGTPTKQAEFDHEFLDAMKVVRTAIDDRGYPDPIIFAMDSHDDGDDTSKEEPDPIICSSSHDSDDVSAERSEEDYESGLYSRSSDSDDSDEYEAALQDRDCSPRHRRSRQRTRSLGFSSAQSAVSGTSLLDTMIAEETEADLKEFNNDRGEYASYDLKRSKSAPEFKPEASTSNNRPESSFSDELYHVALRGIQLAPITSRYSSTSDLDTATSPVDKTLCHNYSAPEIRRPHQGSSGVVPRVLSQSFDSEVEDAVDCISFSSNQSRKKNVRKPDAPASSSKSIRAYENENAYQKPDPMGSSFDETSASTPNSIEAEIMSWIEERERKLNSFKKIAGSPAMTAPETPSSGIPSPDSQYLLDDKEDEGAKQHDLSISFESERSWKEEREIRGGIHAAPLDDFDDDSSINHQDSKHLAAHDRVREARIRRLQLETQVTKRRRARTLDPPKSRRPASPSEMSSVVDTLDLQLIEVLRPAGLEYGPDERSL